MPVVNALSQFHRSFFVPQAVAPTFGEELRRLRGSRSAVEVAAAAGVSQAFLSRLETGGRSEIGLRSAFRLAEVLGVTIDHFAPYFVTAASPPPPPPPAPPKPRRRKPAG
jgi:transcriptional regulator with XRE-family HTH domain